MVLDAGALVTIVLTFLLVAIGFCLTLHVAARYILGDVSAKIALVAAVPATIVFGATLAGWPAPGAIAAILADFFVIRRGYTLGNRRAGLVTLVHYTVSIILAFTIRNIVVLLRTAPA